jgi:hypothetical protein
VAADVPCAGCDQPTPYRVGDVKGEGSFGEFLSTPLGFAFVRTHWQPACVRAARARLDGKPYTPPQKPVGDVSPGT